jgi:drug/metabolite transporter (DMT)-like permease
MAGPHRNFGQLRNRWVHARFVSWWRVHFDRKRSSGCAIGAHSWTAALAHLDDSQSTTRRTSRRATVGGLLLGVAGVYLVVQDKATTGGATPLAWVASLVALLSITFGTIYQKRFGGSIDWRPGMLIQYSAAGILFAFGAMAFETRIVHWTPEFLFALCWLVIVLSFGAIWLLYFLISRSAATRVVSLFYLTPPVTALLAWALFNERLAVGALVGMVFCVIGVFLVNWQTAAR